MTAVPTVPLLLDVDTGIDDALALLFAAADPAADLVGVTTCAGNTSLDLVTRNTIGVLELAGVKDIEVAAGRSQPLCQPLLTTPETHGPEGIGRAVLPEPEATVSDRRAAQLIVETARERPGEITLVALGPLTNVAVAVLTEPELPRLLKRLLVMGGTFSSSGNTTPVAEWNMTSDPEAAAIVYREFGRNGNPRPLTMGLNVTERSKILPRHLEELRRRAGDHEIVRFVEDSLGFYFDFHEKYDGFRGAYVHDPFVVGAALDPSLVETEARPVAVELGGTMSRGQTVADVRGSWGIAANVDVATSGEGELFIERLLDRLVSIAGSSPTGTPVNRSGS
jgi:purine nucleosidase